jgi:hypothetical protein
MQRFGEALHYVREYLGRERMFYAK